MFSVVNEIISVKINSQDPVARKLHFSTVNNNNFKYIISLPKQLSTSSVIIISFILFSNLISAISCSSHVKLDESYNSDNLISSKLNRDEIGLNDQTKSILDDNKTLLNNNNFENNSEETNGENSVDKTLQEEKAVYSFLATTEQDIDQLNIYEQPCSSTGYRFEASIGSAPERCGITFTDRLVSQTEVDKLRAMAVRLIKSLGETTTTNRESLNLQWINLHSIFREAPKRSLFTDEDYQLLINASSSAKSIVSMAFGIPEDKLLFTTVCQFTRYEPVTNFSEFRHVDKVRSPHLIVTSLLWLSTVDVDFGGGRLEFLNGPGDEPFTPILIEPKKGRYAAWTSSHENPHGVHELFYGERYALIFAFTVDPKFGHTDLEKLRTWSVLNKPSFF